MTERSAPPLRLTAIMLLVLWLSGCAGQPETPPSPVTLPQAFSVSGHQPTAERWWTAFDDSQLNGLVEKALEANLSLKAAYERLKQARALAERESATLWPTLDARAGVERRDDGERSTDLFSAGLAADYEVDLWGRLQSSADAEELRASASRADYQTAALSLAGELSNTWFRLLEQRAQRQLAQEQLNTNQDVLALIESRFAQGMSASADVLRQRQLVEASRERLMTVEAEAQVLSHQLAVLTGQPPGEGNLPAGQDLPALPPLPETGLPAELVQRRPDLQRAYLQLQAADADLAAAISNRYPRLTLSASLGSESESADELFSDWLTTLAANLVVPVVDGGRREAEVSRSRALREQRLYDYGDAVLTALREVEDALIQERQQQQRITSLQRQLELADATYRQLRIQYANGALDYIDVLNALRDRQDLRRTLISARRQLLGFRVALYRALAGHFETRANPKENDKA